MEELTETEVCKKCGRELPITEFTLNKKCKDGHIGQCKDCVNAYQRERYARKKGKQAAQVIPTTSPLNPKFADKTPRELQAELRDLKRELIARGFNCEVKLTYLHEINI